jgi:integrase/recombinase XerD
VPSFGPHKIRHAAACGLLAAGAPMEEISQLLRHAQQRTTAIYANPRELHQMGEVCAV